MNELVEEMINAQAHFIQNYAHNVYTTNLKTNIFLCNSLISLHLATMQ